MVKSPIGLSFKRTMSDCDNSRAAGLGIGADPAGRPFYDVRPDSSGRSRLAVAIANPMVAILVPAKMP
jgi:hypothetical protein